MYRKTHNLKPDNKYFLLMFLKNVLNFIFSLHYMFKKFRLGFNKNSSYDLKRQYKYLRQRDLHENLLRLN